MRARFIICVWALGLTAVTCATAQSAPTTSFQAFSGISSITTLDSRGLVTSTTCCALTQVDSAGRKRTAHIDSANFDAPVRRAVITDPVALKQITIDYVARTATVRLFAPTAADRIAPADRPFPTEDSARNDAGEKTIAGVKVRGYAWTAKASEPESGSAAGAAAEVASSFNPTAYPIANEWWWSQELHLFPLITQVDANGNKWIQKFEKIDLRAPGTGGFAVPQGFRVTVVNPQPSTR